MYLHEGAEHASPGNPMHGVQTASALSRGNQGVPAPLGNMGEMRARKSVLVYIAYKYVVPSLWYTHASSVALELVLI